LPHREWWNNLKTFKMKFTI